MTGTIARGFVLSFALLYGADARAEDPVQTCRAFSDVVFAIAQRRDQGETNYEVRSIVIQKFDESVREVSLLLVDHVFKRPWMEANKEADVFFKSGLGQIDEKPANYTM